MTVDSHFTIPMTAWGDFVAKVAKLNKRAAKLGCDPIRYEVIGEGETDRHHTFKDCGGEHTKIYRVKTRTIELHGTAPKLDGWQFIARIEYQRLQEARSSILFPVATSRSTSASAPQGIDMRALQQDQDTQGPFVVRNIETGAQTQVGRQCFLADFTGINRPEDIAARASWLHTFSD